MTYDYLVIILEHKNIHASMLYSLHVKKNRNKYMVILKQFTMILLLSVFSWGCAVCKVQVPDVNVSIVQSHSENEIVLNVLWKFDRYFSAETLLSYDENRNKTLDDSELKTIHSNFVEYLDPNTYLTHIKYVKNVDDYENAEYLSFEVANAHTSVTDDKLEFTYKLTMKIAPRADETLYITLYDEQRFFNFAISEVTLEKSILQESVVISDYSTLFVPVGDPKNITKNKDAKAIVLSGDTVYEEVAKPTGFIGMLTTIMDDLKERVLDLIEDIIFNDSITSYLWLLFFSLLYGIIHALGPGHGKSLVAAYFLGNNRSTLKAFSVASLIGVVHTFSAFILTFSLYYILNTYLSEYFDDLEYVMIKVSALFIIVIALYLLYKKLPKKQKMTPLFSEDGSFQHQSTCGCGACKSTSSDLGVIISAGIIPCPGTITIFVFSLSFGAYMVGFLSAIFMSIGMSLVIFVAAFLSIKVRKNTSGDGKLRAILDYGSLLFIFLLGMVLVIV